MHKESEKKQYSQESGEIKEVLAGLSSEIKSLNHQIKEKDIQIAQSQLNLDKLHKHVEDLKAGLIDSVKEIYIKEFINIQDSIEKSFETLVQKFEQDIPQEKLVNLIKDFPEDIEDRLFNLGVTRIETKGDQFDPETQKVLIQEETNFEEQHKKVVQIIRRGYLWKNRVLRPQLVKILTYKPIENHG